MLHQHPSEHFPICSAEEQWGCSGQATSAGASDVAVADRLSGYPCFSAGWAPACLLFSSAFPSAICQGPQGLRGWAALSCLPDWYSTSLRSQTICLSMQTKTKTKRKKRRTDCAWQLVRGKVWEQTQNLGEKRFLKHPTHIHTEMMKQNREGKGVKGWCKEIQHCHRLFGRNKRKSYQSKHTKSMPCGHTNT